LIIRLIIQTIRRDPSGSNQIDDASNVSRPDPSGADQIDAEHQATDLAIHAGPPSAQSDNRHHGCVPEVDPDQLAALRRLRAAFGPIEVLEVIDHSVDQDQATTQGGRCDQER